MKNCQKSMLIGTLLVKGALIMLLLWLITLSSKNPRLKVCAIQKQSPVPIFSPNPLLRNGTFMQAFCLCMNPNLALLDEIRKAEFL